MLLYHYSSNFYKKLKTRAKQDNYTNEDKRKEQILEKEQYKKSGIKRPGLYSEHISFFLEKPPLDKITSFFPKNHHTWFKGNNLFEYIVDSSDLQNFAFEIVEFPEKTELYYNDDISVETYYALLKQEINEKGYIGFGNKKFEKAAKPLIGQTEKYLSLLKTRPNYNDICYKYAATVPHVMLYPEEGIIEYKNYPTTIQLK